MPVIDAIDEKKYGRLLAKYLPGVIRSDEEHDRLAELLMKLALSEERTAEEERLIELLERLVDDYDERRMKGRLAALEPVALLEHLMEEGGLRQVDLVDCFGSQSVVSAVMAGKRKINSEHARRLSKRFGLPMGMFMG
jgi:HTH-type transcriptional regulator/antitoxin HigA